MTDRDADTDSLTRAFDQNRAGVESFVDRLDTADELLGAAVRSARALRGGDGPAGGGEGERPNAESGPTPDPSADTDAPAAAGATPTDGPATDDAARLAGAVGVDGDDVAAAVETAAELHRDGALSGVTDAVSKEDAARAVEAFLDAYGDPEVDGKMGYLAAVANGLADRGEREE